MDNFFYNGGHPIPRAKVVKRTNKTFSYSIVDSEGDFIDLRLVRDNTDIPLTVKSARIEQGGSRLHFTLEYQHGSTQDN